MRILVGSLIALLIVFNVDAAVIFEDAFDGHTDWSPTQPNNSQMSWETTNQADLPSGGGYAGVRLQSSTYPDSQENTLNIDNRNYRGSSGKALTFFAEVSDDTSAWTSDGLLDIALNPTGYDEIYVRYYIKFEPTWQWWSGDRSPMQKFLHISHYDSADPTGRYDFFSSTQNKPRSIIQLAKFSGGTEDISGTLLMSKFGTTSDSDIFRFETGLDFWDATMIGDGQWHCWEFYYKMNTSDGATDGRSAVWYDGTKIYERNDIPWVTGASPASRQWNYVWLGGNVYNHYASEAGYPEQWYAIDDVVISTTYIGTDYVIGGGTPTYDAPTITGPNDFSTANTSVELEGTYTVDSELTVGTITWTLGESSGFCVAVLGVFNATVTGLELGQNNIVFEITDSNNGTASDTVAVTRTEIKTSKINGSAVLKGAVIH